MKNNKFREAQCDEGLERGGATEIRIGGIYTARDPEGDQITFMTEKGAAFRRGNAVISSAYMQECPAEQFMADAAEDASEWKGGITGLANNPLAGALGVTALAVAAVSGCNADIDNNFSNSGSGYTPNLATNAQALTANELAAVQPGQQWGGVDDGRNGAVWGEIDGKNVLSFINNATGGVKYVSCQAIENCFTAGPKSIAGLNLAGINSVDIDGSDLYYSYGGDIFKQPLQFNGTGDLETVGTSEMLADPVGGIISIVIKNGSKKLLIDDAGGTAVYDFSNFNAPEEIIPLDVSYCGLPDEHDGVWAGSRPVQTGVDAQGNPTYKCRLIQAPTLEELATTLDWLTNINNSAQDNNLSPRFAGPDGRILMYSPNNNSMFYTAIVPDAMCKNGILETPELCDDPNCNASCDGCSTGYELDTSSVCVEAAAVCNDGNFEPAKGEVCEGGSNCTAACTCPTGTTADGIGGCNIDPVEPDADASDMSGDVDGLDASDGDVSVDSDAIIADQTEVDGISETTDTTIIKNCADKTAQVLHAVTPGCEPASCSSDSPDSITLKIPSDLDKCEFEISNVQGKQGTAILTYTARSPELPLDGEIKLIGTLNAMGEFEEIIELIPYAGLGTEPYVNEAGHGFEPTIKMPLGTAQLVASASQMGMYVLNAENGDTIAYVTNQTPLEEGPVELLLTTDSGQVFIFNAPITERNGHIGINLTKEISGEAPDNNSAEFLTDVSRPDANVDTGIPVEGNLKDPAGEGCCTQVPVRPNSELPAGTLLVIGGFVIVGISMRKKTGTVDRQHRKVNPFVAMKDRFKGFLKSIVK